MSKCFIGVDEVGRGPFAGPVMVCAFFVENEKECLEKFFNNNLRDSKKLSKKKREEIFEKIKSENFLFEIAERSAQFIDENGLSKAIRECADEAISLIVKKLEKNKIKIED